MKDFAKSFYKSPAWQNARKSYMKSVGGLCEKCRKAGIYKAGEIVHHKIHITPDNIDDPDITLNWDNLELLCRECHYLMHNDSKRRYIVDASGKVFTFE